MAAAAARAPGRCGNGNATESAAAVPEAVANHIKVGALLPTCHHAKLLGLSQQAQTWELSTASPPSALLNAFAGENFCGTVTSADAQTTCKGEKLSLELSVVSLASFYLAMSCVTDAYLLLVLLHQAVLAHGAA